MPAKFTNITLDEMTTDVLKPAKGWKEVDVNAKEYVFDWTLPRWPGIVVRVYTSISKGSGQGRRKGADAIRICAVDTELNKPLRKFKRLHRVKNWRDNLKARLLEAVQSLRKDFT